METVVISGGSGLVGSRLRNLLHDHGYRVLVLTRNLEKAKKQTHLIHWNPSAGQIGEIQDNVDHVINLAGAGIADKRWTKERKKIILESRTRSTALLVNHFRKATHPLLSFISASAIGYYGDGGNMRLKEDTPMANREFLSNVCEAWEQEAEKARNIPCRLVILRIATVLSRAGGALDKMDATIPFGVANYLGNGRQFFSWIHIDDLCQMMITAIQNKDMNGVYNACAPEELTNKQFTEELRDAINKKALLLPAPALGIKVAFGEMSRVVLNSSRVVADKILDTGFQFEFRNAEKALVNLYAK